MVEKKILTDGELHLLVNLLFFADDKKGWKRRSDIIETDEILNKPLYNFHYENLNKLLLGFEKKTIILAEQRNQYDQRNRLVKIKYWKLKNDKTTIIKIFNLFMDFQVFSHFSDGKNYLHFKGKYPQSDLMEFFCKNLIKSDYFHNIPKILKVEFEKELKNRIKIYLQEKYNQILLDAEATYRLFDHFGIDSTEARKPEKWVFLKHIHDDDFLFEDKNSKSDKSLL